MSFYMWKERILNMECDSFNSKDCEQSLQSLGFSVLCCANDASLTIRHASESFYSTLGYRNGEITSLLGNRPRSVLRGDEPIDWKKVRGEIKENGNATRELRLIKKDGHHIWMQYRMYIIKKNGHEYFMGIANDITLKRRSHNETREQARELKALSENIPGGVLRFKNDDKLTFAFISEGFCRITGYTRDEIKENFGSSLLNMVYKDDRAMLREHVRKQEEKSETIEITYRISAKHGGFIWVMDKFRLITDYDGKVWLYSVLIDITNAKKAEDALAESEARYRLILDYASDPVLDVDIKNSKLYFSPVFYSKFGKSHRNITDLAEGLRTTSFVHPDDKEHLSVKLREILNGGGNGDIECRLKDIYGKYIWCNIHPTILRSRQGTPTRIILLISDIDKHKKETQLLRSRAEHDLLTGLYNRVTVTGMIDTILSESKPADRHAMFVIDIDNFKNVNDTMGHLCGDRLIVETAALLQKQFRSDDVVGRIGGDEFVVFMKNIKSAAMAENKAKRICGLFHSIKKTSAHVCGISGSVGVALFPRDGDNYEEIFQKADHAMYEAKNNGKDNYHIYSA